MKSTASPSSRQALSLVEAVLAMALLAVAYLPLSELFHMTSQSTVKSRNQLIAQHLAADLFELYRVKGDDILKGLSGTGKLSTADFLADAGNRTLLTGNAREIEDVLAFSRMKMKVEIERGLGGRAGLDRIDVTLEWQEDGRPRTKTYARIVYP